MFIPLLAGPVLAKYLGMMMGDGGEVRICMTLERDGQNVYTLVGGPCISKISRDDDGGWG